MQRNLKELFLRIHLLPMNEQSACLDSSIIEWMADDNEKQIDDILVMGVRV